MSGSWELCISIQDKTFRLAVCKFKEKIKKIEIKKAFQIDIPEEFSASRDPASAGVIIGLVKRALKDNKIALKKYSLCISDRSIITRVIKLPKMDLKDLKSLMKLSIHQYFPIKGEDYCFDYKIQAISRLDEKGYYNLLLVAIPKSIIDYYTGILLKCKLKPNIISIYSDVVANFFLKFAGRNIAVLEASYNYTEFIMIEDKSIFINSIINYAIPKNEDNTAEESYLRTLEGKSLGEDFEVTAETLRNYLNFFSSRHHGENIEEVYLIGEGAMLKEGINYLEDNLNIKIKLGQEFLSNKIRTVSMPPTMRKKLNPERFCGCFGLLMSGGRNK